MRVVNSNYYCRVGYCSIRNIPECRHPSFLHRQRTDRGAPQCDDGGRGGRSDPSRDSWWCGNRGGARRYLRRRRHWEAGSACDLARTRLAWSLDWCHGDAGGAAACVAAAGAAAAGAVAVADTAGVVEAFGAGVVGAAAPAGAAVVGGIALRTT